MTSPTYSWNPFQDIASCDIKNELITTQGGNRVISIPRAAPFFSKNLVLRNAASNTVLTEGVDYAFCYPFDEFIKTKSKLAYGGIVLLGNMPAMQLSIDYSTLGGVFVLDDGAWAQSVANIAASSRSANWRDITNLPIDGFPPDPHTHPVTQTLDYGDLITVIQSLTAALNNETNNPTVQTQLKNHSSQSLAQAHGGGTPKDVGLDQVKNYGIAVESDLGGSSNERLITVDSARKLFQLMIKQVTGDYDPTDLPLVQLQNSFSQMISDALTAFAKANPIINTTSAGFDKMPAMQRTSPAFTNPGVFPEINLGNNLVLVCGEAQGTTPAGSGNAVYEIGVAVNFPYTFKTRPMVWLQAYDAYGPLSEYATIKNIATDHIDVFVGCTQPQAIIPFAWFAIGYKATN